MGERRATVWHCRYRADAHERAAHIDPDLSPKVTGEPGNWKVTRKVQPGEDVKGIYKGRRA